MVWVGFTEGNLLTTWTPPMTLGVHPGLPEAALLPQTTLGRILATLAALPFTPARRGPADQSPPPCPPPSLRAPSAVGQEPTRPLGPVRPPPLPLHHQSPLQNPHLTPISSGTGKNQMRRVPKAPRNLLLPDYCYTGLYVLCL